MLFSVPSTPSIEDVQSYLLNTRKLSKKVLERYGVGYSTQGFMNDKGVYVNEPCVTFPWMVSASEHKANRVGENAPSPSAVGGAGDGITATDNREQAGGKTGFVIERLKHRALSGKGKQRLLPKGGVWGFFGWHLVKPSDKSIVITEGEFDAMAVAQVIGEVLPLDHKFYRIPVISLPNGCNSLPPELIMRLERFERIYLWMDNDESGISSARKFASKLGLKRTYLVNPPPIIRGQAERLQYPKDANDALRQGYDMVEMLERAYLCKHERLITFADMRSEVMASKKDLKQFDGTSTPSLPRLTKLLKGFRKGELVVFTGPTGSGMLSLVAPSFCYEVAIFTVTNICYYHRRKNNSFVPIEPRFRETGKDHAVGIFRDKEPPPGAEDASPILPR